MDEELKLLIKHSKVLTNEDIEDLKDSDIPDKFKGISLVKIYEGKEKFKPFNKLIQTLNLLFTYDVDLYEELLDFLVNEYTLKLKHNAITLEEALTPVMMGIKNKINSEGLSNYLFTGNTVNLEPFEIFRSVELLSTCVEHFREEEFTSRVVVKGLSFLTTKRDMRKMFAHLKRYPFDITYKNLVEASIDRDNVVFLDYLVTEHKDKKDIKEIMIDYDNCVSHSASKGSLDCLKYVYENGCPWDETTCSDASRGGNLDCLKYAHEHGCPWDDEVFIEAARNGHLDCLKYAHVNGCTWNDQALEYAAMSGHLDCLKYIHEIVRPGIWDERICCIVAKGGYLDCLQYAHDSNLPWDKRTYSFAASYGHLDCLKYLHENGGPGIWDETTCENAANSGHLDCLKYAHENGCPWNEWTCKYAARYGHLNCLKYAHENGCPWGKNICSEAARGGHLDCLKYAHENGCPWDEETCKYAAMNGHLDCLKYARENGCPCYEETHQFRNRMSTLMLPSIR